jgi:hypothetical protein
MKNQARILSGAVALCFLLLGCSKNESTVNNVTLKQAVNQGTANLNKAMSAIASTRAYNIFTISGGTSKSAVSTDSTYKVYIPLNKISGVYEYKPVTSLDKYGISLIKYFNRTADNSKMIVRLPLKKVQNPRSLRHYSSSDSLLTNNFSISVSDYHNNYNSYLDYDYSQVSEITVNDTVAGQLDIKSIISPVTGTSYASQFEFAGGYTAKYKYLSGDTTVSSFSITSGDDVLYEEKLFTIKNDTALFGQEHEYILTIGDVEIIRKSMTESPAVYVNGVLQENAEVSIIDKETASEASVCKKRDIQITFDDGTITTVSALINNSVDNIKTIFDSLHSVYFAAYIVDWIAYDIYYERN